jgi:molybdopterin-binding protein
VRTFRISAAAELLGVSDDTLRRWIDSGRLGAVTDRQGRRAVEGVALAEFARSLAARPAGDAGGERSSARNRFRGIVTAVQRDTVMAQVEIQAGPFRVVSLMSREAADSLELEVGAVAVAVVKSTNVVVERADPRGSGSGVAQ